MLSYAPLALFHSIASIFIIFWAAASGIYGTVTAHDEPIAGATVSVFLLEGSDYASNVITRTDHGGHFSLTLRPGEYIVLVTIEGKRVFQGQEKLTGKLSRFDITLDPSEQSISQNSRDTCSPVVKSLEIYERTFTKLTHDEQLNHFYVYAGDIHRTPFHLTGSRNDLYLLEFDDDPLDLNRVERARDKRIALKQMQAQAVRSIDLSYEEAGSSTTFSAHKDTYHLTVIAVTNRPGSDNESVTIAVCRQGTG